MHGYPYLSGKSGSDEYYFSFTILYLRKVTLYVMGHTTSDII